MERSAGSFLLPATGAFEQQDRCGNQGAMDHEEVARALLRIASDEDAQRQLAGCTDLAGLAAALAGADIAAIDWTAYLEAAARQADRPPAWQTASAPPRQWLPVQLFYDGAGLRVEWLHFAFALLVEPFFEQSADRARAHPMNLVLRCSTPVEALLAFEEDAGPDALVFHMSRCGSTLVGQMLASLDEVSTVAEPPPLDTAVRLWLDGALDIGLVRGMARALVRDRFGSARQRIIKLDAWHSLSLNRIADLFPAARTLFLFRDPIEVLVSQSARPGMHVRRGAVSLESFGLRGGAGISDGEFAPWVIGAIARGGLAAAGRPGLRYYDYSQLPQAIDRILDHFAIPLGAEARCRIEAASRRYSKDPDQTFIPDIAEKQAAADPAMRAFAGKHGLPNAYLALRRLAQIEPSSPIWSARRNAPEASQVRVSVTYSAPPIG